MKLTITFELPEDFTDAEKEIFQNGVRTAVLEAIQRIFEYRAEVVADKVVDTMKIEETK